MAFAGAPPAYSPFPSADQGVIFSPNVPYIGPLAPLCDGYMITLTGRVLPKADRFHVNLSLSGQLNEQSETAIHINPRFVENTVVRNSFLGRCWAAEERGGGVVPLQRDKNFEMIILVTNPSYKIAFNGKHFCEFKHRTPIERVTHLVVEGDVMLHQIKITDPRNPGALPRGAAPPFTSHPPVPGPQGYPPPPMPGRGYPPPPTQGLLPSMPVPPQMPQGYPPPPHGISAGYPLDAGCIPGMGINAAPPVYPTGKVAPPAGYPPPAPLGQQTASKPCIPVPHLQALVKGVEPGLVIRIHARPKHNAKEMRFDFVCNNQDLIAFHFNPRFREKIVVRNTKSGNWGKEERQQPKFPFVPGKEFDMIIYCDPSKYQVTIDGENFITYNHRIRNLANIRYLKISADVDLYSIQI